MFDIKKSNKLFYRWFLLHPASQLQCGAGGALRLSGGASYDPQLSLEPESGEKTQRDAV